MATIGNGLNRNNGTVAVNSGNAIAGVLIPSWPENGDVTAVRVDLEDTGGAGDTFQVGIYSGNTRVGLSASRTDISTAGTYEFTFSPAISLTAAATYRVVLGSNSGSGATMGSPNTGQVLDGTRSSGSAGLPPSPNSGGWDDLTSTWRAMEIEYTPAAAGLAVTDVDTDESITGTQTNVVITGTGFEAAQGGGTVEIFDQDDLLSVEPSIDSWSDTSIQFDMSIGTSTGIRYGAATLHVTNDSTDTDSIAITITPPSGVNYVNLSGTLADPEDRLESSADLEAGDQVEWSNVVGGSIGDVTVNIDGSFTAAEGVTAFDFRVHNVDDGWGSIETQTIDSNEDPPEITTAALDDATASVEYTEQIEATGDGTLEYSATGLPPGLSISSLTGAITGTPSVIGSYTPEFTVTNEFGEDVETIGIEVVGIELEIPASSGRGRRLLGRAFAVMGGR